MKSITFNNETITVKYDTHEEVEKIKWIFYNHELNDLEIEDNILTFHYKGHRFLDGIVKDIISKTFNGVRTKTFVIDKGTSIYEYFESIVSGNNLFQVSVINQNGTSGVWGFGIWQWGRILTFDGEKLTLRNSNLDDVRHELSFGEGLTVNIKFGEVQFQ